MNVFQVGDIVIGKAYPDDIPAVVTFIVKPVIGGEYEFPLVEIEYSHNGHSKKAIIQEYRLMLYQSKFEFV